VYLLHNLDLENVLKRQALIFEYKLFKYILTQNKQFFGQGLLLLF
jgi:hypothetical protein